MTEKQGGQENVVLAANGNVKPFEENNPETTSPGLEHVEKPEDTNRSINEDGMETEMEPVPPPRSNKRNKRVVTELRADEIRWFYKRSADDTKWRPLNGRDSLLLEVRWRQKNDVPLDRETVVQVSMICKNPSFAVLNGLYRMSESGSEITPIYWNDEALLLRRGSWFYGDYQPIEPELADLIDAHHLKHFRGQSIPESAVFFEKDQIKRPVLTVLTLQLEQAEIVWNSVIDVTLFNTSAKNRFLRYMSFGKGAVLTRCYKEKAYLSDSPKPIGHLIFVVHGVGQKGYEGLIAKNTDGIRDLADTQFEKSYAMEERRLMFLPVEWRSGLALDNGLTDLITLRHVEAIRNTLNATAMDIMYYQSPLYRQEILGGLVSVMNSLYALFVEHNPEFNGQISLMAHSLGSVMAYDVLTGWSPMLLYDQFITHMIGDHISKMEGESKDVLKELQQARSRLQELEGGIEGVLQAAEHRLTFKVANLFCIGSPLGVFLAMRGQEAIHVAPKCEQIGRIYNIFHPADPVAYRLEPLIEARYRHVRPVKVCCCANARLKTPYSLVPMELHKRSLRKLSEITSSQSNNAQDIAAALEIETKKMDDEETVADECDGEASEDSDSLSSPSTDKKTFSADTDYASSNETRAVEVTATTKKYSWWKFGKGSKVAVEIGKDVCLESSQLQPVDTGKKDTPVDRLLKSVPNELRLERRLDFSLQQGMTEVNYWSVLKSHFMYWTNQDLVAFILTQLYDEPLS